MIKEDRKGKHDLVGVKSKFEVVESEAEVGTLCDSLEVDLLLMRHN